MTKEIWSPTTAQYYERLKAISPNYSYTNFKRNDDNVLVDLKPGFKQGELDPFLLKAIANVSGDEGEPSEATERLHKKITSEAGQKALLMRSKMGIPNLDIAFDVEEKTIDLGSAIIYQYTDLNSDLDKKPCFVYYHGGDFYGESAKRYANLCRLLAELCHGIVLNVDYRLTPEVSSSDLLQSCNSAVKYAHDQLTNVAEGKLFVAGDSAGGNIASVMSYLDRKDCNNYIDGQVLIYPMTDNRTQTPTQDLGSMPKEQQKIVTGIDSGNRYAIPILNDVYADSENSMSDPTISPNAMTDEYWKMMPRTMVIAAGYDCLNLEGYTYAYNVAKFQNDVTYLMYGGMTHAFINEIGIVPQAEDAIRHMALWVNQPVEK